MTPRIANVHLDSLPEKTRESFDRLPKLNIFKVWANAATIFPSAIRYGNSILSKLKLSPLRRELLILAVGRLEGGHYEWVQHVPIARNCGCSEQQIAAIESVRFDDPAFDAAEKALLKFVREIVQNVKASDSALADAAKHFDPQELVEIV